MSYIRLGWKSIKEQFYVVIILFLYQLLWGFFLYKLINSVVVRFLQRYPDPAPNEISQTLFLMEGQLRILSSSSFRLYLWMLIGMLLLRMIVTPLIRAGIYNGLIQARDEEKGLPFFTGMKKLWKPVILFYWLEIILLCTPAYWIIPKLKPILLGSIHNAPMLLHTLPYIAGWFIYGYLLHQIILYMQFGLISRSGPFRSVLVYVRYIFPSIGISLVIGGYTLFIFGLFTAVSWIWAGFLALLLQQAYHFFRSLFDVWQITSQYQLWYNRSHKN
ncbi:hypothetical protein PASE110613_17250 [Paenibacillus sediminis]|uniref:DUF975 family protein n=1 Tax=Paenibacillus sediminis TaxID=664909 RepID=A0ABS4H7T1_9BACL|nr:hypothetical protein [Paenibacillus sediminis]MBP1938598.1 hypothetical protein [Paenibacillus sediminis]